MTLSYELKLAIVQLIQIHRDRIFRSDSESIPILIDGPHLFSLLSSPFPSPLQPSAPTLLGNRNLSHTLAESRPMRTTSLGCNGQGAGQIMGSACRERETDGGGGRGRSTEATDVAAEDIDNPGSTAASMEELL